MSNLTEEQRARHLEANEKISIRASEVRAVIASHDASKAWDTLQSKDLDSRITDFISVKLHEGYSPPEICRMLGLPNTGCKQWKKIQAWLRAGFRADAEVYLFQQTHKFYKAIDKARELWEDAVENGTPHVVEKVNGDIVVHKVKGATKELCQLLDAYGRAIEQPVKLWKTYGAIGERKDVAPGGTTIFVQNNIQFPSPDEIRKHKEAMIEDVKSVEADSRTIDSQAE